MDESSNRKLHLKKRGDDFKIRDIKKIGPEKKSKLEYKVRINCESSKNVDLF